MKGCRVQGLFGVRHVIGTGPGRSIFNIIVTGHVLSQNGDLIRWIL
jgi:hypothetical protein